MPIPTPTKGETREKFVARCMGNEVMKKEFPENRRRLAVCFNAFSRPKKAEKENKIDALIEAFIKLHPEIMEK